MMGYRIYAKVLDENKEEVKSFQFGKYVEMFNELRNDRVLEMKEIEHAFNYHKGEDFKEGHPNVRANNVIDLCEYYRDEHDLFSTSVSAFVDAMYNFVMNEQAVYRRFQVTKDVNMFDLTSSKENIKIGVDMWSEIYAGYDLSRCKMMVYRGIIEESWIFEIAKIFKELEKIEELEKCTVLIYGF